MIFYPSKNWDRKKDLPVLNFKDEEIEKETYITNTSRCGECFYLGILPIDSRDKYYCFRRGNVLTQIVNPGFANGCRCFKPERLFLKRPPNEKIRKWIERM